ncbi:hypothetical protein Fcan01_24051 [Folsomia candida]|uniref:Uncharacterized protein n=1 Tax=Folsomia candida TaxID=158441 RepID=A0A226D862_FOLCA|nr:hypothetical protein Fcan01_24051 [Folsomia candida]
MEGIYKTLMLLVTAAAVSSSRVKFDLPPGTPVIGIDLGTTYSWLAVKLPLHFTPWFLAPYLNYNIGASYQGLKCKGSLSRLMQQGNSPLNPAIWTVSPFQSMAVAR